jgi:hypothetical protein
MYSNPILFNTSARNRSRVWISRDRNRPEASENLLLNLNMHRLVWWSERVHPSPGHALRQHDGVIDSFQAKQSDDAICECDGAVWFAGWISPDQSDSGRAEFITRIKLQWKPVDAGRCHSVPQSKRLRRVGCRFGRLRSGSALQSKHARHSLNQTCPGHHPDLLLGMIPCRMRLNKFITKLACPTILDRQQPEYN